MVNRGLVPQGGFTWQNMAQMIARANPGISPDVLGKALVMSSPLINQMSMMDFRERQLAQGEERLQQQWQEFKIREARLRGGQEVTPEMIQAAYEGRIQLGPKDQALRQAVVQQHPDFDEKDYKRQLAGLTSEERVRMSALARADSGSLKILNDQENKIQPYIEQAKQQGDVLVALARDIDLTGLPPLESWIREGRKAFGDPKITQFMAQLEVYRDEAGRILNNPSLTGQFTVSAKKDVKDFLAGNASAGQIAAVVDLLNGDFDRRDAGIQRRIEYLRNKITGGYSADYGVPLPGKGAPPPPPPPPPTTMPASVGGTPAAGGGTAPAAPETRTIGGKDYIKINGQWYEK
jgi:hypothetical protein